MPGRQRASNVVAGTRIRLSGAGVTITPASVEHSERGVTLFYVTGREWPYVVESNSYVTLPVD